MSLSPYSVVVFSQEAGNVIPFAQIAIKIRNPDGSSGAYAPIYTTSSGATPITQPGASADMRGTFVFYSSFESMNAEYTVDGVTVTLPIGDNDYVAVKSFPTVADAVADGALAIGDTVITQEHSAGNGGGAQYVVVAGATGTDDGGSYHDCTNGLQLELVVRGEVNSKQFGLIGDGVTNDTEMFNSLFKLVESGVASKIYINNPSVNYSVDPILIQNCSNFVIEHESNATLFILRPQDLAVELNTYIYKLNNCSDFEIIRGKFDGNKTNQINVVSSNFDHECIDLKSCSNGFVRETHCLDAVSEGIDLDACNNVTVFQNLIENTGGYGIHNSVASTNCKILFNTVKACGIDKSRGGVDAFKSTINPALYGVYIGNEVSDCYQNYNIEFNNDSDKLKTHFFDSSNLSKNGTNPDVLTGVRPSESFSSTPEYIFNRGFAAMGCRLVMPDANTLQVTKYKESTGEYDVVFEIDINNNSGLTLPFASGGINISPSSGTKWRFKRNGGDGFLEVMNDDSGTMERVFAVDKDGDILLTKAGKGLVLVSPDGLTTRKLTIDNSGNLSITGV